MKSQTWRCSGARWIKFNLVGALGILVQLSALALLGELCGMRYLPATALAVETAVLHNFIWHERFTWADRGSRRWRDALVRFFSFNLSNGAISLGGNLLLMLLLVGGAHLPELVANLISVACCSTVNFLVSDRWVFRAPPWPPSTIGSA